jgi:hypothetical protein
VGVQIGTAVLVRVSVSVWNWQYGNSGLVGVQIGTAVLVSVSVSVWNWQYGNSVLVGGQIGTAVLVRVSVFHDVQWIAYNLKCWTAWSAKLQSSIFIFLSKLLWKLIIVYRSMN